MVNKCIYAFGEALRNPHLNDYYVFLKRSEKWPLNKLQEYQAIKCKELLVFANQHSKYFKRIFQKNGFDPQSFKTIGDLSKLPITTKKDLIDCNEEIHTDYNFRKCFIVSTSGSTGTTLRFKRNEEWDSFNRASVKRGYSWYGVDPSDRNGYFWGYNIAPDKSIRIKACDMLVNRFRIFSYKENELIKFINKLKHASYLSGYSSMIYEIARIINKKKLDTAGIRLKLIKGTSEKIYDYYHLEVQKAFGKKIISEYGAAEAGIITFECPFGTSHINMEGLIIEEVGGEIVITNLNSHSFPIIRYKLGDYIKLSSQETACPCGMAHPAIEDVLGRVGSIIYGKKNMYPSLTLYYIFKNIALGQGISLRYQCIQREKGRLTIYFEQELNRSFLPMIKNEIYKYFRDDIEYDFKYVDQLHKMDGKLKDFISLLKV